MFINSKHIRLEPQADRSLRPPLKGSCALPVVRQLDRNFLPIWNTSVLRSEWRSQLRLEQQLKNQACHLTPKQVKAARNHLLSRSLAGPLPRQVVADASAMDLLKLRKLAKETGFWVRSKSDEMGHDPFQQMTFQLFREAGEAVLWFDFDAEVQADMSAQKDIDETRHRRNNPPAVPKQIGAWEVMSEPFMGLDKRNGLSWWVECRCAAPGCQHRISRWRPVKELKRSRARQCRLHNTPPSTTALDTLSAASDSFEGMRRRHMPDLLWREPELTHPDMAQGALADFRHAIKHAPSLVKQQVEEAKPLQVVWSQYFPPAPYEEMDMESLDFSTF